MPGRRTRFTSETCHGADKLSKIARRQAHPSTCTTAASHTHPSGQKICHCHGIGQHISHVTITRSDFLHPCSFTLLSKCRASATCSLAEHAEGPWQRLECRTCASLPYDKMSLLAEKAEGPPAVAGALALLCLARGGLLLRAPPLQLLLARELVQHRALHLLTPHAKQSRPAQAAQG